MRCRPRVTSSPRPELFVEYLLDRRYGWVETCQERFGLSPQVIFHEGNSVLHSVEYEGDPRRRRL